MATVELIRTNDFRVADDDEVHEVVNSVPITRSQARTGPSEDDPGYEVIRGVRVELPPMATDSSAVAFELGRHLSNHARAESLGRVQVEMLFLIDAGQNSRRRPDASFVSYGRWPKSSKVPKKAAWAVVPDLAVEVVSPTDHAEDAMVKIRDYFDAGVRLVWIVYPNLRLIHSYESFTSIRVLSGEDILDGGEVIPRFKLPLPSLFEDIEG